ncbi:hypothetical protein HDV00_007847 [Rhizophlyctis rosea]|nr:hypothetical protein HDV00_007847 [Rhizophlyctis rosea]
MVRTPLDRLAKCIGFHLLKQVGANKGAYLYHLADRAIATKLGKRAATPPLAATPPRKKPSLQTAATPATPAATPFRTPFRSPLASASGASTVPKTPAKTPTRTSTHSVTSKTPRNPFSRPFKSPSLTKPSPQAKDESPSITAEKRQLERTLCDLETRNRRLKLAAKYMENDEPEKIDALIQKWVTVTREAITRFRDNVGPVIVPASPQQSGWDAGDDDGKQVSAKGEAESWDTFALQPRLLTLKEMCERLKIDPSMLGEYDEDNDCFVD